MNLSRIATMAHVRSILDGSEWKELAKTYAMDLVFLVNHGVNNAIDIETRVHTRVPVKLVTEQGMGVTGVAKKLALSVKTYSCCVREARAGTLLRVDTHSVQPVTDLQAEVRRLKRELAVACEERDIPKKATALLLERAVATLRSGPGEVRLYSAAHD